MAADFFRSIGWPQASSTEIKIIEGGKTEKATGISNSFNVTYVKYDLLKKPEIIENLFMLIWSIVNLERH